MSAAKQHFTVVGVFEDRHKADQAVSELLKAGFRQDQIGVAVRHAEGETRATTATADAEGSHAGTGALAGALTGLGLGTLAGMGVLSGVIPVVGPAIAAGTLGVILSNAAAGAGITGLIGALIGAGIPEHEAKYYHKEFEAGRTIVTVKADGRADDATAILRRYGAYDMSTRGTAAAASTTGTSTYAATGYAADREAGTMQVKEERLRAEKRPVETGEVSVRKEVHTENKTLEVPVQREEIVVERFPVHGKAATQGVAAGDIGEGEQFRIPVREEQLQVHKDAVVTEEVRVGKQTHQDVERVSGQVRKEDVKVDQTGQVNVKTRGADKGRDPV